MKNKFENLLDTRKKLDEVLEVVKKQNTVLEREVEESKSALYDQMFEDMYELYEYANQLGFKYINLDTGLGAYAGDTIWLSLSPDHTILLSVAKSNFKDKYCYCRFKREGSIEDHRSHHAANNIKRFMEKVLSNWDVAFSNMQDSLAEQAKVKMEKDIQEAKRKQEELMNDYGKYKKGV
jgi:hemoglobin-like flavoprotein